MEMENMKEKLSFDLWLSLLDMKATLKHGFMPKATVWNDSEKFMFVKIHVLKKHMLPNFTVAFVDILWNNEKLVSSV